MIYFVVFLALALLRFTVLGVGAALLIRPVRACPACFEPTLAIRRPWLRRLAPPFEWRWCPTCRWEGPARRTG